MKFTTPAFVRVENPQERKELIEWCASIGYSAGWNDIAYSCPVVIAKRGIFFEALICVAYRMDAGKYHDCGTNILLFKALAAMNDDNGREQWFVCIKGHMVGDGTNGSRSYRVGDMTTFWDRRTPQLNLWRKATAEEIIEHFKNKEK